MTATIPAVCLLDDLCRVLQISRSTIKRLRRHGAFPIRELPSLDKHPRWSGAAVEKFLAGQGTTRPQPWRQGAAPARQRRAPRRPQPTRQPGQLALRARG